METQKEDKKNASMYSVWNLPRELWMDLKVKKLSEKELERLRIEVAQKIAERKKKEAAKPDEYIDWQEVLSRRVD